jgi:hypothetical protein
MSTPAPFGKSWKERIAMSKPYFTPIKSGLFCMKLWIPPLLAFSGGPGRRPFRRSRIH